MRQTVNISEVNRLTGIDRATLAKHLRHLEIADPDAGSKRSKEYYLDDVLTSLVQSFKVKYEDGPKVRKEIADAEKAEINVARLRGDLVPVGLVRSSAADLVKSLYQRCVNLAPRILSDKITGNTERAEVEIALREHYAGIFDELRSLPNNFLNVNVESTDDTSGQPED